MRELVVYVMVLCSIVFEISGEEIWDLRRRNMAEYARRACPSLLQRWIDECRSSIT